jgi:hypothetical protein
MDHIPSPANPRQPLSVKYRCKVKSEEYDHKGYYGYPVRKGIDIGKLKKGDLQDKSVDYIVTFLQQWLYFGLLEEVFRACDVSIAVSDFVTDLRGGTAIEGCAPGTTGMSKADCFRACTITTVY